MRKSSSKSIEQYDHRDTERVNNPPVGLVTPETDPDKGEKRKYKFDMHLDPQLQWAGKEEHTSFEVPTVSLHVHERIDPKTIIHAVKTEQDSEAQLPGLFSEQKPLREAIDFYRHKDNWSNRLIAGDSLLVMNSLLEKEAMGEKVQMAYFDPPYGIKYGSNFQPFVSKLDKFGEDKDDNLTAEPETIKAFRDTWELGIHSYLSYLRDRILLVYQLLHESGSIFVQIGDENVLRVGLVIDEIFGSQNRVATISFATTSGSSTSHLPQVADYLLWYAKDKKQLKYRQLYEQLTRKEIVEFFSSYVGVELSDGQCKKITQEERFDPNTNLPEGARLYKRTGLDSQGVSTTGRSDPYIWNGTEYPCPKNRHWSISREGMDCLAALNRLDALSEKNTLMWKLYEDEVPGRRINNIWPVQMRSMDKRYVVETAANVIQRCMLMTSDPGDLVLDITCGSGTTADVAEKWGRRWITCDTSRVALTLAKQRLITATFDYYKLAYPEYGIGGGLQYKSVSKVNPSILASRENHFTVLYDQPIKDSAISRITGPFTVEAVPAPYATSVDEFNSEDVGDENVSDTIALSGETLRQSEWREELLKSGVRGKGGQRIVFSRVEPLYGTRHLQAIAETRPNDLDGTSGDEVGLNTDSESISVAISFGPEHSPLEQRQVALALEEVGMLRPDLPKMIIFVAFQFDPEAAKDIDETPWPGVTLLRVYMNSDLQTGDLKKRLTSSDSFWLIGQPDVRLEQIRSGRNTGKWFVQIRGFDYFNTKSGQVESGSDKNIAVWMLDTDYDGRSLYPRQVFFPMSGSNDGWSKLARNLKGEIDEELIEVYKGTQSLPFEMGEYQRIAVKVVDDRGIESLRIVNKFD